MFEFVGASTHLCARHEVSVGAGHVVQYELGVLHLGRNPLLDARFACEAACVEAGRGVLCARIVPAHEAVEEYGSRPGLLDRALLYVLVVDDDDLHV